MENNLKIGDRIIGGIDYSSKPTNGIGGTVIGFLKSDSDMALIEFDTNIDGHDGMDSEARGRKGKSGYCYYIPHEYLVRNPEIPVPPKSIIVDGIRYIQAPIYDVVAVKHLGSSRILYFDRNKVKLNIDGSYVYCDTKVGTQLGKVVSAKNMQEEELISAGATLPLKKVIREATKDEVIAAYEERAAGF